MFKHSLVSLTLLSHPGHTVSNSLHILTFQRILFQTVSFANDCFIINNVDLLDNAEIQPLFGVHDPWQHIALLLNWHCGTLCMRHDRNNTSTALFHTRLPLTWDSCTCILNTTHCIQIQHYIFPNLLISAWGLDADTGRSISILHSAAQ